MRRSDSFNLDQFLAKTNSSLVTAQNELNVGLWTSKMFLVIWIIGWHLLKSGEKTPDCSLLGTATWRQLADDDDDDDDDWCFMATFVHIVG